MTVAVSPSVAGTAKVVRFNWPKYVGVAAILVTALLASTTGAPELIRLTLTGIGALGCAWAASSLVATWWIYDHRRVYDRLTVGLGRPLGDWASVHAGFDDATPALAAAIGHGPKQVAEISMHTGRSLRRARRDDPRGGEPGSCAALPFATASLDTVFATFSVHEVRDRDDQRALFAELHRALRRDGRLVVTEHRRDLANLAVYGPGAFHFQAGAVWRARAAEAGFARRSETTITPFVHRSTWQR